MILVRRVASALTGVGISGDDSELRDAGVQPGDCHFYTLRLGHDAATKQLTDIGLNAFVA